MSAIAIPLSVILIIVMVVLLVIYSGRKPKIFVGKEGVFIKDFMYPSRIFAETIKISLVVRQDAEGDAPQQRLRRS